MTHARHSAVLAAAPLHTDLLFGAVAVTVLAAGVIVIAMIAGTRGPGSHFDARNRYGEPVRPAREARPPLEEPPHSSATSPPRREPSFIERSAPEGETANTAPTRSSPPPSPRANQRDVPFLVGAAAGVVAVLGGISCLVLIVPVAAEDATRAAASDPLAEARPGECVAISASRASGHDTVDLAPVPCETLPANFRVLQTGTCTDPRVEREHRGADAAGYERFRLCLAPDWQAGTCYDVTDWHVPSKVDCARVGKKIVRVNAVLPYTPDAAACPRDAEGAGAVGWAQRGITLCLRGSDRPDE
ncbi:hypothetical protein [Nocardia sputi]|uniref:hypothetical protein n=1 Tax=Nocardia sputi TaxID=2943705 RepID=UPI0020C0A2FD|nr:hypothetical protein [Nocardia sputi]